MYVQRVGACVPMRACDCGTMEISPSITGFSFCHFPSLLLVEKIDCAVIIEVPAPKEWLFLFNWFYVSFFFFSFSKRKWDQKFKAKNAGEKSIAQWLPGKGGLSKREPWRYTHGFYILENTGVLSFAEIKAMHNIQVISYMMLDSYFLSIDFSSKMGITMAPAT